MNAADTSVAVAAALPWHESHDAARSALAAADAPALAQVVVETYSVLTRLPPPQRVSASVARQYVREAFSFPPLVLGADSYADLLDVVADEGIVGGAVYDAVVAAMTREAGATLLTLDQRAVRTYRLLGIEYRLVG